MKGVKVPLTEEEIKSLQMYMGWQHADINIIADMDPRKINILNKIGWGLKNLDSNYMKQLIQRFVDVYGAIYKSGQKDGNRRFYRGTTNKEIENLRKSNLGIISTTTDEDIARRFCEYGDAAILYTHVNEGLPYMYVEGMRGNGANEEEILILPFAKVKSVETWSKYGGYTYYNVKLEKGELPELTPDELEELRTKSIEQFDEFFANINRYNRLEQQIKDLKEIIAKKVGTDKFEYIRDLEQKQEEQEQLKPKIDEYKSRFETMLKGMCRQKELEIDKQRQEIKEEKENKLNSDIEILRTELNGMVQGIIQKLMSSMQSLKTKSEVYSEFAKKLGVDVETNNLDIRQEIENTIRVIIKKLEEDIQINLEDKEEVYENLVSTRTNIEVTDLNISGLLDIVNEYDNQATAEIKEALNKKVQDMIYRHEMESLNNRKNEILNRKQTIFQKIFHGTKLQDAQIENIDAKMKLAEYKKDTANPDNRVRVMLQDIYDCAYRNYNGKLTDEMLSIIGSIGASFDNLPTVEELRTRAEEKVGIKALALPEKSRKKLSQKEQINALQNETQSINKEILLIRSKSGLNVKAPASNRRIYYQLQQKLYNSTYFNVRTLEESSNDKKNPMGDRLD